jgi:G:T/U-mismatch repair DNA glycosylase
VTTEYEVKKVPKVIVQGIRPGEIVRPTPINQFWFVVEHVQTGDRYSEHDVEADAVAKCEQLNSQPKEKQ